MKKITSVEDYLSRLEHWAEEGARLREILVSTELDETVKWGMPTYTCTGKNVVALSCFKNHFGLWFFQGALLDDEAGLLTNAQPGKTKAMRQWRMTSRRDIKPRIIKRYVSEAAHLARTGKATRPQRAKTVAVPAVLKQALSIHDAEEAFSALSPAARREYCLYVIEAKRDSTKQRRIMKIIPMIRSGAGLNELYRRKRTS